MLQLLRALFLLALLTPAMAAAQCTTYGDTNIEGTTLSGNLVTTFSVTVTGPGTISNVTAYTDGGSIRVGVYASSGGGEAGLLLAESASTPATAGWNTVPLLTPLSVTAGTYWLAFQGNGASLFYGGGALGFYTQTTQAYGPFPPDMTGDGPDAPINISIYTMVCLPTPTPTPSGPTPTPTPVPQTGHVSGSLCNTTPVQLVGATNASLACNLVLNNSAPTTCRVQVYNAAETLIGPITLGANSQLNLWDTYTFTSKPNEPIFLKSLDGVSCIEYKVQFRQANQSPYPW